MSENIVKNEVLNHGENVTTVANWIDQIDAGGIVYDIATHHGITFRDGKNDSNGVKWNGLSDLEIIIPNITDIVQTPIEFAGTVGADGKVDWNTTHTDGPKEGYLIFFTADCDNFSEAGIACEAGDMAVYANGKWNIVSGENQVKIVNATDPTINAVNRTVVAVGAAKDVLVVEGKALSLTLDYEDLDKHVHVEEGDVVSVDFGDMKVEGMGIKLSQANSSSITISEDITINEATSLTDGGVTISGTANLVTGVEFGSFSPGSFPTSVKNSEAMYFNVTGGSLSIVNTSHFLTGVSLGNVTFNDAKEGDSDAFPLVNGISPNNGKAFLTGVNGQTSFTVAGGLALADEDDVNFVKGLANNVTEVVTSINSGSFTYDSNGTTFVTGLADDVNSVVTNVSLSATNNTSVLNEAKVSDHILSFGSVNVASSVSVETTSKEFIKGGYIYTSPTHTATSFVMGSFTTASDVTYTFTTDNETTYETTTSYYKITTPDLVPSYGGYELKNDGMKITVSSETFVVDLTQGTPPSLTNGSFTTNAILSGLVTDTSLTTLPKTIRQVAASASTIELPGVYSIVSGNIGEYGVVTVGAAGELSAKSAEVDLSSYITGVSVGTSARQ